MRCTRTLTPLGEDIWTSFGLVEHCEYARGHVSFDSGYCPQVSAMDAFLEKFTNFLRENGPRLALGSQACPRFWRSASQVLSDQATWNESPAMISILPNAARVATGKRLARRFQLVCSQTLVCGVRCALVLVPRVFWSSLPLLEPPGVHWNFISSLAVDTAPGKLERVARCDFDSSGRSSMTTKQSMWRGSLSWCVR